MGRQRGEPPHPDFGSPAASAPGTLAPTSDFLASAYMGRQHRFAVSARVRIPLQLAALAGSLRVTTASQTQRADDEN